MVRNILFALVVWYAQTALHAQAPPLSASAQKTPPAAADAAFTFERMHTRVRFENDGSGRREQTWWIKVLDEQAVRQFGEFPLVYQSESEDLALTDVTVQKPDGTLVPTPPASVQDLAAIPPGQAPIYVDVRQKIASVTALRPGDVLRITGVWTVKKPIAPGHFWFEYSFDVVDAVKDEQLEIDLPADRSVALKVRAGGPAEEHGGAGASAAGRRVYRWKTKHPEAATQPRLAQPGDDDPPADVRLSSFRTWDEFARWFTPLAFAKPDAVVKAKADALTAGAADEAAKISAIYRFVSTEIRYVSLSFGLGRFAAHPPADVLRTQYGDCKDKAVLLGALLDAVGVRAVPVVMNTTRSVDDDFASPLEFDHMLAVVPRAASLEGTWMDATLEVAPLGMLGPNTRDRRALALLGDSKGALLRTPVEPAVPSTSEIALDGAVNAIGVLDAKVSIIVRGDQELVGRALVRAMPRTALKDFVSAIASTNGISGAISEPATSDPADTREPFRLSFRVRQSGFLDWAAARSELTVPLHDSLPYATDSDRKDLHRLHFASTSTSWRRATIELPPGYDAAPPQSLRVSRAGLIYTSDYRVEGSRVRVERATKVTVRDVPEAAFGEYASLASAVEADRKQHFIVRGTTTGTPAIPADATPDELYKAARSAWDAKRYDAALTIYKRTTELAPKMGDAWIGLGLAYDRLGKWDEAAAAIQKQIDLDPYNKRAYGDLGYVLKNAGKNELAIKAYKQHTELNALDGSAFKELGLLYVESGKHADAIPVLEKGIELLPRDAWVAANLVRAYLSTTQSDKASKTVDRVMDRKPNPEVREYVAWHMAQHGFDLARAEELARAAEKDFLAEFRDLDLKSVTQLNVDHVDRLAWTWDAIGWIDFQRGKLTEADAYVRAAWQLMGHADVAYHLGRICEKRNKLADAMNYYLTAQALDDAPSADLIARVKKLAGGGDLPKMLQSARQMAPIERSFQVASESSGTATFLAIVDNGRKAVDVRFASGDDSLKPLAAQVLRAVTLPVLFPTDAPVRIPLGLRVYCRTTQCLGMIEFPTRVKLVEAAAASAR